MPIESRCIARRVRRDPITHAWAALHPTVPFPGELAARKFSCWISEAGREHTEAESRREDAIAFIERAVGIGERWARGLLTPAISGVSHVPTVFRHIRV